MSNVKRMIAAGSLVAVLSLTAACGNDTPQGPFVTPTAESTTGEPDGDGQLNDNIEVPDDLPTVDPSDITDVELMPFQYDWTTFEPTDEAKEYWGEDMARKAMPTALGFLDTAYSLGNIWAEGDRTLQDFEALRDGVTPEVWTKYFQQQIEIDEEPSTLLNLLLFRETDTTVVTADGVSFTPDPTPPITTMVENPRMTVVTDEENLGSTEPRYTLGATFTHQFFGTTAEGERVNATYKRDVALYMIPTGDQWYVDAWYSGDMTVVE